MVQDCYERGVMSKKDQIEFTNLSNQKRAVSYQVPIHKTRILPRIWWKPSTWFNRVEHYTDYAVQIPDEIESKEGDAIVVTYETEWLP